MIYFLGMPPTRISLNIMPSEVPVPSAPSQPASSPRTIVRIADAFARSALIGFFALIPIFVLPYQWAVIPQGKVLLVALVAIIVVVAWATARFFEGAVTLPKSALLYVGILLPIAYVISTGVAGWHSVSLVGQGVEQDTLVAVVLWYAMFALSIFVFSRHHVVLRASFRAFLIGLTALALLETLYIFFPSWFSLGGALQGTTANPLGSWHDLGILSGIALFFSVAFFRTSIFPGFWRILLVVLGALSLFLIILIHFQDVLWAMTALSAVALLAVLRSSLQADGLSFTNSMLRALPWLIIGVAMALGALIGTHVWDKLPARIQISEVEVRPSWQGTLDIAKQSLGAPTSLLFGSGPNSFIREWGLHKPQSVNATPFWNSDFNYGIGIIPTSIFAVGLFGLLAWAAILLVLLGLLLRFAREVRPFTTGRTLFGALVAAVIYLVAFQMIYTPGVAVTGITFLLMGLLAVAAAGDAPPRRGSIGIGSIAGILRLILLLVLSAVVIAAGVLAGREVVSNLYANRGAYDYRANQDVGAAGNMISKALSISPDNDRAHRAAAELGIIELSQLLAKGDPQTDAAKAQLQTTLQETIQHGLSAVSIDSSNYQNWLSLAQIYSDLAGVNVEGAIGSATSAYQKAFEAQPTNPLPKLRLAQLAIAQGDRPDARTYLQEAIALKPDFAAAYYLLSQVEAADGNGDPAVNAASQAVQLVPTDPIGWFNLGYILYAAHSYENAVVALERAASLTPDYANAMFILGLSYSGLGRTDDAVRVLERVAALNASETWIPQLIANVKAKKDPFAGIQQ